MTNRNLSTALPSKSGDENPSGTKSLSNFYRFQGWATAAWVYTALLAIATVMLGTFVVAFTASLKDDALKDPMNFDIPQLSMSNWLASASLGSQGSGAPILGGFAPGAIVEFEITYAVQNHQEFTTPKIVIPRRTPGTGMAAAITKHFAADYAQVSEPELVQTQNNIDYVQHKGIKSVPLTGKAATWKFTITYPGEGPTVDNLPMDITAPRHQVLVDSTLSPSRFERRGRVASWVNVTPGFVGYVFRSYVRVYKESVSLETGKSLFLSWTINSFFIAIGKVLLTIFVACTAGYALARMKFAGARPIFLLMIFSMTVPMQVTFISNYEIYNYLGLLNSPWAVITMLVASGQVLIMKQFFEKFPRELEEAAIVDGATPPVILFEVFMPLAKPAIASVTILGFQGAWNDFFWPMVVLTSPPDAYTLPVGLLSLRNAYGVAGDWNLILAGSFLSTIPVLIVFVLFQRYFVGNEVGSAVKG